MPIAHGLRHAGFRYTGQLGCLRVDVPNPPPDPGRGQPPGRCGPFPRAAQVSGERAPEAELGVAGDDQPGPAVRGGRVADLRDGPAEDLLEQAEGVLKPGGFAVARPRPPRPGDWPASSLSPRWEDATPGCARWNREGRTDGAPDPRFPCHALPGLAIGPVQYLAGLTEVHACGGSAGTGRRPVSGACDDGGCTAGEPAHGRSPQP